LADELQWPAGRQRPYPPPRVLIVRGAAAAAPHQNRPRRLGVTVWRAADNLAAIGELQTDLEGLAGHAHGPSVIGHLCVEARDARPDEAGHEEFESAGIGPDASERGRGLLGPAELEGIDRHDARKLRHRQVPRTKQPVLQTGPDRYRSPC